MRPRFYGFGLALLITVGGVGGAMAGERQRFGLYRYHGYAYDGGYGLADAVVGGAYIGAPFTRFPRPNEIVPPAWGYGTYGVPTVTGIRQAPTAAPTLTVIHTNSGTARRRSGIRTASRGMIGDWSGDEAGGQDGARILSVTVPQR